MLKDPKARLVKVENWGDYYLWSLESPSIAREARPGQFIMIKVSDGDHPLLRRPISLHARHGGALEVFFKVAGIGTRLLARKKPGDLLDILGPLGKGYTVGANLKGKTAYAVGGGRGIAPLYFLSQELSAVGARTRVFYGGKTLKDIPLKDRFARANLDVLYSTDDGSFGFRGLVTELFAGELVRKSPAMIYACGPDPMMKAVADGASRLGIPAEFSLESIMGCGIGACWGCVRKIKRDGAEGWLKVCEEGPVFPGQEIVWSEAEP
jgi:dihydroorotate dehydrogenase electron transfer subunit